MRRRGMTISDKVASLALAIRRELLDDPATADGRAGHNVRIGALLMAAQTLMTTDRWDGWVAGIEGLTPAATRRHIAATNAHRERLAAQSEPLPAYMPSGQELILFEDACCSTNQPFAAVVRTDRRFDIAVVRVDHASERASPLAGPAVSVVLAHAEADHLSAETRPWYFTPASVTKAITDAMAGPLPTT